jgi:class 3 adenylate cyclase/tetratricopeptide (TPR) repeat protein
VGDRSTEVVTYLPASLVRGAAARPSVELPWYVEVDGTMVMADLSGFTALSERLARAGDEGAERLVAIINSFFDRMLKTAGRYGGDTLTFGGDAILLLFDGPDHATRAAVAALEMLRQVERAAAVQADDGRIKIGMSVGAHSDRFVLVGAGLADERAHLVVLGHGGERTALAEAQADRGQLAVSTACRELLPAGSSYRPTGDFWLVDELGACAVPRSAYECPRVSEAQFHRLMPFLPPYARAAGPERGERLQTTPEHRRTVIVFVDVLGLTEILDCSGLDAAVEQLQAYTAMLTGLAAKHHGYVVSSDIATKGSKLVVTFGAPVAHEYAPANAARFALDLSAGLRESGLDLHHKIGVNGGHVFAGEVGPSWRRQYTVMGDAVNLAARLMAAAALDRALVNRNLVNYLSHTMCACELPPITVKGKAKPVAVCVLEEEEPEGPHIHGALGQGSRQGRLFGRRKELDLLARSWERVRRRKGQAILVEGEAGVGKTRLLDEALRAMGQTGQVTRAAGFEHLQAAPFTPWVDVLQPVLGISPHDCQDARTGAVEAYLAAHLPDQVLVGALLNPLLNLSLAQSEVVHSLDAQARRERLFELVARVLEDSAGEGGHAVVIEDLHWLDESSLGLAAYLCGRLKEASVLLLMTTRPSAVPAALERAEPKRVVLAELSEPESLAMLREALGVADLPVEVGETLYAKTRGNPLFLEEVIRSLQAPGVLDRILDASSVMRAAELAALEIPDRVQGLLMSRIDRLPPDAREVLKAGSVVGRSFDVAVLAGMDDEMLTAVAVDRALDELIDVALVVPDEDGDPKAVSFRHALVQDVAYESLPFARRRELHGRVAGYLESTQAIPDHGLLVHHYRHAGDGERTRLHALRASESSVAVYANLEGIDYLALALETASGSTSRDACLRSRLEELMGDSLETLARYDEAVDSYSQARRRWASPRVRAAAESALSGLSPIDDPDARDSLLCWKIAVAVERGRAEYGRALRWLDRGAVTLPPGHLRLTARQQITRGGFLSRLGRFREAVDVGEQGVALAREDGDAGLQAYGLTLLGVAFDGLGNLERSRACHTEAIGLYEQAGDLHGVAMSHGNLADSFFFLGDLRAALEHDELSLSLHARIGSASWIAREHTNLGATLLQLGELEAAEEHLREALQMRTRQGVNPVAVGMALVLLCQVHLCLGRIEAAAREVADGRQVLEGINSRGLLLDAGIAEAELHEARGELDEAEAACLQVLTQATSMEAELNQVQALCALGRVRIAQGLPQDAVSGLEEAVALAERMGAGYERARTLAVLAEAQAACDGDSAGCDDSLRQAIRLFEKMGARYELAKTLALRDRLSAGSDDGAGQGAVAAVEGGA